ncbi:MAG: AMP-binding protein [Candidatus Margulisiibacteriota bacterium]|nr:AMP-binding protein [Candidatus Margulisiibacteriota bacterium]
MVNEIINSKTLAYVNKSPVSTRDVNSFCFKTDHFIDIVNYSKDVFSITQIFACLVRKKSFVVFDDSWPDSHKDRFKSLLVNVPDSTPVVLIATSGSTGMPKLVCHPLENLFKAAQKAIDQAAIESSDSILLSLSPSSMGGLLTIVKAFLSGAILHLNSDHWSHLLVSSITNCHLMLVPQQLDCFIKNKPIQDGSVKSILVGGDAVPYDLKQRLLVLNLPFILSYGATETCGQVLAAQNKALDDFKPLPNVHINNHDARLLIKTDTLALGYITQSGIEALPVSNGFFITNDLVDFKPSFKVIGRVDFQFQSGAKLVSPEFIEQKMIQSGFAQHVVIIPKAHSKFGHVPISYVSSDANINKLKSFCALELPVYMQPNDYILLDADFDFSKPNIRNELQNF